MPENNENIMRVEKAENLLHMALKEIMGVTGEITARRIHYKTQIESIIAEVIVNMIPKLKKECEE